MSPIGIALQKRPWERYAVLNGRMAVVTLNLLLVMVAIQSIVWRI